MKKQKITNAARGFQIKFGMTAGKSAMASGLTMTSAVARVISTLAVLALVMVTVFAGVPLSARADDGAETSSSTSTDAQTTPPQVAPLQGGELGSGDVDPAINAGTDTGSVGTDESTAQDPADPIAIPDEIEPKAGVLEAGMQPLAADVPIQPFAFTSGSGTAANPWIINVKQGTIEPLFT